MRFLLASICALLASCAGSPQNSHPTKAVLHPQSRGGFSSQGYGARVFIKAVDGNFYTEEQAKSGIVLDPGARLVTITVKRNVGGRVGNMMMGPTGMALGNALDEMHATQFERDVLLNAQAGHSYVARFGETRSGDYRMWIDDVTR